MEGRRGDGDGGGPEKVVLDWGMWWFGFGVEFDALKIEGKEMSVRAPEHFKHIGSQD